MSNKIKLVLYFFGKLFGAFALARKLSANKIRILCYHGGSIGDEWKFNGKLFITKITFERRVNWLQANGYHIVSLSDAVALSKLKGRRTRLSLALTFDDGWFSTGRELLPVLSERKLPSTLYLSTKYFQEGWPIFSVAVRYILWKAGCRKIEVLGFDENVDGTYHLQDSSSREQLIGKIVNWLTKHVNSREKALMALNHLAACTGKTPEDLALNSRRFDYLSAEELHEFAVAGCSIELHGHVHSYPAGDPEQFYQDLTTCKTIIGKLNLPEPKHYCYPSGNFDSAAAGILQKLGIDSATTCRPGLIGSTSGTDKYYLARFLDGENVHMLEFEAEMSGFADFLRRAVSCF